MHVIYLGKNENKDIRRIIELEYAREETNTFLNTICSIFDNPFAGQVVAKNLIDVVNTIILDHLVRIVKSSDTMSLVLGMQNSTLGLMMESGHRHYVELITEEFAFIQQSPVVEKDIIRALDSYVNWVYLNNKEELDPAILNMFELIYNNLGHLNIKQHRVTFVDQNRPALILIGDQYAANNANASQC